MFVAREKRLDEVKGIVKGKKKEGDKLQDVYYSWKEGEGRE